MRRLWSHIILAATSLLMVGATFATVVTNIDSNIEYNQGKELVFRINEKDDEGNPDETFEFINDKAVKEVASIMEDRLNTAEVSRYVVETQGYDTIRVRLYQETDYEYKLIKDFLSFNATLAISNSKDTSAPAKNFLNTSKKAYVDTIDGGYPAVIVPINKDDELFQAVYTEAKDMADNNEGEYVVEHDHEDGEEEEQEERKAFLYLWYDYVEDVYTYDKIATDPIVSQKILMKFDAKNPFLNDDQDALRAYSDFGEEVTAEGLKTAYQNARYTVNLINAGKLNYHVTFLFSDDTDVLIEDLVTLGDTHMTVAWSMTFVATLCAIVVVSLLLVYFYRLGALSVSTISIVTTFLGLLIIVLFGAEFNVAGIMGLIALAFTSIVSGVIYLNKLKDECYRGRSLKKANSEAAKKALLPTLDVHVAIVALGVSCYIFGGVIMKAFALATVLGGLVSLVLNVLGLRGMMWLVTNEPGIANRYDLFDVANEQVPNALEEEKQKYYGPYAEKNFTKAKKPTAIIALVLMVASLGGMIYFGVTSSVYQTSDTANSSQVYVEYYSHYENDTNLTTEVKTSLETMLDHAYLNNKSLTELTTLKHYAYDMRYKTTRTSTEPVYYAYYRIAFNNLALKGNETIVYKDADGNEVFTKEASDFFTIDILTTRTLADLTFDSSVEISLKNTIRANKDQPKFTSLILATAVGAAITALYLLFRYRLSRGLASLGIVVLTVTISAGIFSLLHFLPVTSYVAVSLPFVALFTYAIAIIFMNKEREMVLEDRSKDASLEARENLMIKALSYAATPMIVAFILALYLGVNFYGFMSSSVSWVFLAMVAGVIVSLALVLVVFGPFAHLLYKWFSKVQIARPKLNKKKKARPIRVKKSAEPEEAIFIGIND